MSYQIVIESQAKGKPRDSEPAHALESLWGF